MSETVKEVAIIAGPIVNLGVVLYIILFVHRAIFGLVDRVGKLEGKNEGRGEALDTGIPRSSAEGAFNDGFSTAVQLIDRFKTERDKPEGETK